MSEISRPETKEQVPPQENDETNGHSHAEPENEFRVTIRKLKLPVRPRGVLAE